MNEVDVGKKEKESQESSDKESTEKEPRTIFSKEEIEVTVRGFLLAWIRGTIKINFITAEEIEVAEKKIKTPLIPVVSTGLFTSPLQRELARKKEFADLVEICVGITPSSPSELQKAINSMFSEILALRATHRIEGTFLDYGIEERMNDLERKLDATNRVVIEFIKWYRGDTKGEGVPKM